MITRQLALITQQRAPLRGYSSHVTSPSHLFQTFSLKAFIIEQETSQPYQQKSAVRTILSVTRLSSKRLADQNQINVRTVFNPTPSATYAESWGPVGALTATRTDSGEMESAKGPLEPSEFDVYNRLSNMMQTFVSSFVGEAGSQRSLVFSDLSSNSDEFAVQHNHFRRTWKRLQDSTLPPVDGPPKITDDQIVREGLFFLLLPSDEPPQY